MWAEGATALSASTCSSVNTVVASACLTSLFILKHSVFGQLVPISKDRQNRHGHLRELAALSAIGNLLEVAASLEGSEGRRMVVHLLQQRFGGSFVSRVALAEARATDLSYRERQLSGIDIRKLLTDIAHVDLKVAEARIVERITIRRIEVNESRRPFRDVMCQRRLILLRRKSGRSTPLWEL